MPGPAAQTKLKTPEAAEKGRKAAQKVRRFRYFDFVLLFVIDLC
jgi:hypothetical protein